MSATKSPKTRSQTASSEDARNKRRSNLSQLDVPSLPVQEALRIPAAIADAYAYRPTKPINVATALNMQPTSGSFKALCGAAIGYGLTEGGYNAAEIAVTPLGLRIVRPTSEGDDLKAKREAVLKPRIVGEFLQKYADAQLPRQDIAQNVLVDMGVPQDRAGDAFQMIIQNAEIVGFIRRIKDKTYISLGEPPISGELNPNEPSRQPHPEQVSNLAENDAPLAISRQTPVVTSSPLHDSRDPRKVFVTHGKNVGFIEPIKKLLSFGEMEPIISVNQATVSQPISDKVIGQMRQCGAAIIHIDDERRLLDKDALEHVVLNPNVLIEIGAAMALYDRRFILLVKDGVQLPSNLQGLFEVRYKGDALDGEATIRLLEAINDIKNHKLPS